MARTRTRRRFLKEASALSACIPLFSNLEAADPAPKRAERIRVAVIGVAGQGAYNMGEVHRTKLADIVALCDVDENRAAQARKQFPKARFTTDYRRLFDQKDIQAVVIATPDHHHALAAARALRSGKHVYCEKPLTHSVHEGRVLMNLAARNKLVTQMGTQIHALENYRRVVEIVQAGVLGPVR